MKRTLAVLALCGATLLAACGDDPAEESASDAPAGEAESGEESPERIVSLSPTATEMLFAIGAGDQVVAVDDQSNFPAEAPTTDLSGSEPNVEAIAGYEPDLVVMSDGDEAIVDGLELLDIEVVVHPPAVTLEDTYEQIGALGDVTGTAEEAEDVVTGMQSEIDELVAEVPERPGPLTYYHELDDTLFTATSETFIGEIYSLAGLENIADAADSEGGGFPQLTPELIVDADPDLVFLADTVCCAQTAETFAERPGFADLTAVTEDQVIELNDDIASRWGPRVVDFLEIVVDATETVPVS